VRGVLAADEKPQHWVGSRTVIFLFPAAVKDDMGNALGIAQFGGMAPTAKPWKGLGPGVLEVVESHEGNAYRAVTRSDSRRRFTSSMRFRRSLLPAYGRPKGMYLVAERLKTAHEEHYGKPKR
jgi:hypothetical protein